MAIFVPKKIKVMGAEVKFTQSSLSIKMGYGEISFDMLVSDTGDATDIRNLVKNWKSSSGIITIFIEPDGIGIAQNFVNMSLTNDPSINESPAGSLSLTFMGQTGQLN